MEPFTLHTGRGLPLRRSNVDTDQIIPAQYMTRVSRSGYGEFLFAAWREDPGFVLNQPAHAGASILVAGPDFGIGSSREHAVWALLDAGFRAVISPRFGDIFRTNAGHAGLLAITLGDGVVSRLQDMIEADPAVPITLDLVNREVRAGGARLVTPFTIDDHVRWRLLEGLDDIALALRHENEIASYERRRPDWLPTAG